MNKITQRTHERLAFHAPITHSMYNRNNSPNGSMDNYHDGIMGDISAGGLFFESATPCWGNGPVYINFLGKSKSILVTNKTEDIPGTVVWCRESAKTGHARFMIGVKFDKKQAIKVRFARKLGAVWLS